MRVEIKLNLDHAIESITDALYFSENVTDYEHDLIYNLLFEIKKQIEP